MWCLIGQQIFRINVSAGCKMYDSTSASYNPKASMISGDQKKNQIKCGDDLYIKKNCDMNALIINFNTFCMCLPTFSSIFIDRGKI